MTPTEEKTLVRDMARRAMEIASGDEMAARRRRWRDAYMLRKPDRVPVWLNPNACREEILPESELQCADPFLRSVERPLRWMLTRAQFNDDPVYNPYWKVRAVVRHDGEHLWGVETKRVEPEPGAARGAWAYEPPITSEADMDRLRQPVWSYDAEATERTLSRHAELFDDIMPVRRTCGPPISPGLANHACDLMGIEALMLNMAMAPDMVHRLMAFLRDAVMAGMDFVENQGLLDENNDEQIHLSESLKQTPPDEPVRFSDRWLRLESQNFEQAGPEMWKEFLLAYQAPLMARCRYVSYGCCENLTRKIDGVMSIPNLRIFVNGPWTDLRVAAEHCAGRACVVWRQKATDVVYAHDVEEIRRHLEEGMKITQGVNRVIVLQELMTTNDNPARLTEWVETARDVSERLS